MRKIWNTMLKGLVAGLPIGLTVYVVYWLAVTAERVFSGAIKQLVPAGAYWPGLGLLAGLIVLYVVGLAVNAYVVRRALRFSDRLSPLHPDLRLVIPERQILRQRKRQPNISAIRNNPTLLDR